MGSQPADRSLAVMQLGRKRGRVGKSIGDAGDRIAVLGQPADVTGILGPGFPATTVDPDNQVGIAGVGWQVEVQLEALAVHSGKLDVLDNPRSFTSVGGSGKQQGCEYE